jgi:hypothetical protein
VDCILLLDLMDFVEQVVILVQRKRNVVSILKFYIELNYGQ